MDKYRIRGGELRSVNPIVVRYRTGTPVELRLGGTSAGHYADGGDVRIKVTADAGSQTGPTPPRITYNYGQKYTEFTFVGAAVWSLDGDYLVIESLGTVTVDSGAATLPASEAELGAATLLEWLSADDSPGPHRP